MSKNERNEISILLHKKYPLRDIAVALRRSVSTISDEIKNNSVKGVYDPAKAQHKAYLRRHKASYRGKKIVSNNKLKRFIEKELLDGQSPEAISGRIKHHEKRLPNVSKNSIYRFLRSPHGEVIGLKLKKKKRPRKRRKKVTQLKDRVFIDKRPKIIEKRGRVGDLEIDFIVSGKDGKGVLLVAVDRKFRVCFLKLILEVTVDNVHAACQRIKKKFPELKSMTLDNDLLFQMHKTLEQLMEVPIYFCHPYHSWEKGTVENRNKIIRQFIPKGSDLSKYDDEEIKAIENYLNSRYLECLKYATPDEKLKKYRVRKKKIKKQR